MSKADNILGMFGEKLTLSRRLRLDEKTEEELKDMLRRYQNNLYRRVTKFSGIPPSKRYRLEEDVIREQILYYEALGRMGKQ